ncbi:19325_t:CDS:2 [Funneliformis geosporum]|nr:19325_t:CDS:2 [Funneliformis geosporum]
MYSFNGEFDDSSATRSANNISVMNKLNDYFKVSLGEPKSNHLNDAESNTTTTNANSTITSTYGENASISSCNDKMQQQDDEALHDSQDDDEARAFKSQFDEIKCATRMLENSKNNAYNRFQGFAGRVPTPLQRRVGETGPNPIHQRSYSYSTYQQQTNRHMLKPQRSISSIKGLSLNGNSSAYSVGKFYSNQKPSTPYTSHGFDLFDNADDLFSPLRLQFDDSNSVNGNDDAFMRYKDIENGGGRSFNPNRFGNNGSVDEWDDSYPSTPISNGQFTPLPLTPSSTYSNRSPYLAHQNSLLDDEELIEKAKLLEDKQRLILIQQRQLDNALAALNENEARYKLNNTTPPPMPTRGNSSSSLQKNSFGSKLTVPPPRFQTSQDPIGPPTKKSGYNTPLPITPTESNSPSPTFSLFSNPPALSLNQNLMNQQQNYKQTMVSDKNSFEFNPFDECLTPSNSSPKTKNNDDGYFSYCSHPNIPSTKNNIWAENNYFSSHQETKRNDFYSTNYKLLSPTIPASPASYFRASLYSSPVNECEEENLFADEYFSWNNKRNYDNNFILYL